MHGHCSQVAVLSTSKPVSKYKQRYSSYIPRRTRTLRASTAPLNVDHLSVYVGVLRNRLITLSAPTRPGRWLDFAFARWRKSVSAAWSHLLTVLVSNLVIEKSQPANCPTLYVCSLFVGLQWNEYLLRCSAYSHGCQRQ